MVDDVTAENPIEAPVSEGEPTAENTPAWASEEVSLPSGKKMKLSDLVKSYPEAERTMHKALQDAADGRRRLEELKWAETIRERYNSDPDFRTRYDEAWTGGAGESTTPNVLSPELQRLHAHEVELEQMKFERGFDKLRGKGLEVSGDDETKVLSFIRDGGAKTVEDAYKALFWEREIEKAKIGASAATSQHMAETRNAYPLPPKGAAQRKGKFDPTKLSKDEFRSAVEKGIKEALFNEEP